MNFFDITLSDSIPAIVTGGPSFLTTIATSKNKNEIRSSNWNQARYSYKINYTVLNSTQLEAILSIFNICRGKGTGFKYKDWADHQANNSIIGIGDATTKSFQLAKQYNYNNYSYSRTIVKPLQETVSIYLDNQKVLDNFTIDHHTGIVTLKTAPKNGSLISASFDFYVPVRFNNDTLDIIYHSKDRYEIKNLELVEINVNSNEQHNN